VQKVESSSLFSRFHEGPANRGVFVVLGPGRRRLCPRISSQDAARACNHQRLAFLHDGEAPSARVAQCRLHERLRGMPPPDQLALLGDDDRAARQHVELEIGRAERALREAWTVLSEERAPWLAPDAPADAEAWPREPADTAQLMLRPLG
jgi:hypothetical protein